MELINQSNQSINEWGFIFIESWRFHEKAITVAWGRYNLEQVKQDRPGFKGDGQEWNAATGVIKEKWRFRQTLTCGLASLPAFGAFGGLLVALVCASYILETVFNEVYKGPFKQVFVHPLSLFCSFFSWHADTFSISVDPHPDCPLRHSRPSSYGDVRFLLRLSTSSFRFCASPASMLQC
jgi:hypothetical protein